MSTVRGHPKVRWSTDWQNVDVEEALNPRPPSKQAKAADMLRDWLADGPKPMTEIQDLAKEAGFSIGTVKIAKREIGVQSVKDGAKGWLWQLP